MFSHQRPISAFLARFEAIPKVGSVLKASRIRPICEQLSSALNKGSKGFDKVVLAFDTFVEPLNRFSTLVSKLRSSLSTSMISIEAFVETITKQTFCLWQEGRLPDYDFFQKWIEVLLQPIAAAYELLSTLTDVLSLLNKFSSLARKYILKPFDSFNSIIKVLFKVVVSPHWFVLLAFITLFVLRLTLLVLLFVLLVAP
jgi:hypothetical protein